MAFCNVKQYKAKRLFKTKNIISIEQVEQTFKSSAYYTWNLKFPESEENSMRGSSTLSLYNNYRHNKSRRYVDDRRGSNISDIDQDNIPGMEDQTIIPLDENMEVVLP